MRGQGVVGRKGTPRCESCHKRRSKVHQNVRMRSDKCVYTSVWTPCNFCVSRNIRAPCIKLWDPLQRTRIHPPRPFPTPVDDILGPQDCFLLRYAFSDCELLCFLRLLATVFVTSLGQRGPLRLAVLALAVSKLFYKENVTVFDFARESHESHAITHLYATCET